jgi:hypothetical protein
MRTLIALCLLLAAGSALAANHSGAIARSPLDRSVSGLRDPLDVRDPVDVRDPLMHPPSDSASLPDLGSSAASTAPERLRPRPLPGTAGEPLGSPHYWESDPLYIAPRL